MPRLTLLQAVVQVLEEADEPLHYREIARRLVARGLWHPTSRLPEVVGARLAVSVQWSYSPFRRTAPGWYDLKRERP